MAYRVVLINPPVPDRKVWVREGRCQQWDIWGAPFPPLSLALVSTQLKKEGFETRIIDSGPQGKDADAVLREVAEFGPAAAVLSVATPTLGTDLGWFAGMLRERFPGLRVAGIGIHVSALPGPSLDQFPALDFAVIGEPELTVRELLLSLRDGGPPLAEVRGLAYRRQSGAAAVNPAREFAADLDSLGLPDWGGIDFKDYPLPITGRPFTLVVFSRGCPFRCKFCATQAYSGGRLRARSVPSLIAEIKHDIGLGVRDFLFWTEQMTLDARLLDGFLEALLREGLHREMRWVCNSRVDLADEALFRKMRAAGCWQIAFGFEFGDDRILKLAGKGGEASAARGRQAAEMADRAGLLVDGHFIMGYPGETEETMEKTRELACSLPLTFAHFYAAVPFPGSALYDEAVQAGWLAAGRWAGLRQDAAVLSGGGPGPERVDAHIRKAYRSFYLRLGTARRILAIPRTLRERGNLLRLGVKFFRELLSP